MGGFTCRIGLIDTFFVITSINMHLGLCTTVILNDKDFISNFMSERFQSINSSYLTIYDNDNLCLYRFQYCIIYQIKMISDKEFDEKFSPFSVIFLNIPCFVFIKDFALTLSHSEAWIWYD